LRQYFFDETRELQHFSKSGCLLLALLLYLAPLFHFKQLFL